MAARAAHGPVVRGFVSKLSIAIFLCSAAYVAWMFVSPQLEVYRAKSLVRNACTQAMRDAVAAGTQPQWEDEFIARLEDLELEPDSIEYGIEISDFCEEEDCSCAGNAAFRVLTPWPFVSGVVPSLHPRLSIHRVYVQVTYR